MTRLVAIVGPTASGKSQLAMEIAQSTGAEILSVDSMQVYRGMDIGTAKPTGDERSRVRHHMIDVAEPEEAYTVARFRDEARSALATSRSSMVLVVGGSGLHFRSVVDPMRFRPTDPRLREELQGTPVPDLVDELQRSDPDAEAVMDVANPRRVIRAVETIRLTGVTPTEWRQAPEANDYREYRPELEFQGIGLDRTDLSAAVARRMKGMVDRGFLREVEELAPRLGPTSSQAVGYRELTEVVEGRATVEEGVDAAREATLRLAKRQRTFFRRDPRLRWFDADDPSLVESVMKEVGL